MGFSPASIDLIVATMDLKMVQSVVRAMRAADAAVNGHCCHPCGLGFGPACTPEIEPRRHIHPEPTYEPRPRIHPTPRYERRPVIHPNPRFAPAPPAPPVEPEHPPRPKMFHLIAPWQILPWKNPPQPAHRIKVVKRRPDITRTGALLDVVI